MEIHILLAEDGSTSDSKGFPIVQYICVGKNWVNESRTYNSSQKSNNI